MTPLEIMPRRVLVQKFIPETKQVPTNGIPYHALLVKLVINTLKQCQKSVMDCGDEFVAAQEVGFDNLCEIIDERPSRIDTLISHMRGRIFR